MATDLVSAFFSIPIRKEDPKQHIHVRWKRVYNYGLVLGYVNDLALCRNMAKKEMECLTFHRISHWSIILTMPC